MRNQGSLGGAKWILSILGMIGGFKAWYGVWFPVVWRGGLPVKDSFQFPRTSNLKPPSFPVDGCKSSISQQETMPETRMCLHIYRAFPLT